MSTTDYFTYINAMFLFCIFTCGLLVWAVIRGYILKGRLTKEQDAHLKATLINTKLNKALEDEKKISDTVEKLLRQVETEVRALQYQLDNVQKTADHYIDLSEQLHQQLAAAKRARNAKGVFVRKDGTYTPKVKPLPTIADEVVDKKPHALRHGMTVKNPTEKEAKEIFEAARVAGIKLGDTTLAKTNPWIWAWMPNGKNAEVFVCGTAMPNFINFVTPSEFIARIKGEEG